MFPELQDEECPIFMLKNDIPLSEASPLTIFHLFQKLININICGNYVPISIKCPGNNAITRDRIAKNNLKYATLFWEIEKPHTTYS